jgi:hypothetical protein
MLGTSWVAEKLAISHEGLSSMSEWIQSKIQTILGEYKVFLAHLFTIHEPKQFDKGNTSNNEFSITIHEPEEFVQGYTSIYSFSITYGEPSSFKTGPLQKDR